MAPIYNCTCANCSCYVNMLINQDLIKTGDERDIVNSMGPCTQSKSNGSNELEMIIFLLCVSVLVLGNGVDMGLLIINFLFSYPKSILHH